MGAGVPESVTACTVNAACGSGLKSIALGSDSIRLGRAERVLCGGMENMSMVPFILDHMREGYRLGHTPVLDGMYRDGFVCPICDMVMGETAEVLAGEFSITRDEQAISKMKPGVMIINTSRGALVDTPAAIEGLKSRRIGHLGLDVYEEEGDLFFEDQSDRVITDDVFSRLLTFPNVIVTGHQAFFTRNALSEIARVTGENLDAFEAGAVSPNDLT